MSRRHPSIGRAAGQARKGRGVAARMVAAGVAAAAAVAFFSAPPALAAGPTVTIASPANEATVTTAVVNVSGQASMRQGGTVNGQIVMKLTSLDGHPNLEFAQIPNGNPAPFNWPAAPTHNGRYMLTVDATGRDAAVDTTPSEPGHAELFFNLAAPPAPPANLRAAVGDNRYVEVNWDRNAEPDLVGYQVQRSVGSNGQWEAIVNTADNFFTDTATASAGGDYRYRIVAVRRGATADSGVPSEPSESRGVEVDDPPPGETPTTTPGGGTGGTGGGGGSGGTGGGGGAGGTGGTGGGGGTSPELARTGKVDLSGFSALLQNANRPAPKPGEAPLPDGTFDENLPFQGGDEELAEDGTGLAIGVEEAGEGAGQKPIAFFAASMLVTVILMHVIWLKRQVDSVPIDLPAETA